MLRLSYRLYLLVTGIYYRLPRRLTRAGLLAGTGLILAGAIGSDIDQSMAFVAFAFLLCILVIGVGWIPFFRGRFTVRRRLPRLASVGQPFRYRVQVANRTRRRYRGLELLEELADPRPPFEQFARIMRPADRMRTFRLSRPRARPHLDFRHAVVQIALLPPLAAGGTVETQVDLTPLRRGPLRFRGAAVARPDPLGLVRSFVRISLPETVLVLPKRYRLPPLLLPGTRNYQPGGVAFASSIGESEEFVSLRDYRPGDPFRRLHWRSWARLGRPIVKEYQAEFFARHGLVLDTFVPPDGEELFEEAVAVAASFACSLDTQESLLDLLFVEDRAFCFTSGRGVSQPEQLLGVLASVQPSRGNDWQGLRGLVLRHASALSGCVCVFLAWDEARQDLVRSLRAQNVPVLVLVVADPDQPVAPGTSDLGELHVLRAGQIAESLQAVQPAMA